MDYERMLREGISRSSQKLKAQFLKHCESKAKEFLDPEIQEVRKKLHEDFFKSMDMVQEEIDVIKQRFQTHGPKYSGSQQCFAEVSAQIISKAATYLTITNRKEQNIN